MQESPAAAGGNLLPAIGGLVPSVMMQIARQEYGHAVTEDLLLEERQVVFRIVAVVRAVYVGIDPVRLCVAEDDAVTGLHLRRNRAKVIDLRLVDVRIELNVGSDQPPAMRKLDGEVASLLSRLPSCEPLMRAEQPRE